MKENSKYIIYMIFIVCLTTFLWNSIHYFKFIQYTSEFAGSLGNFFNKTKLIFMSFVFAIVTTLIAKQLLKKVSLKYTLLIVLLIVCTNYSFLNRINHSILFPAKPTITQQIKMAEKEFKIDEKEAKEHLAKGVRFLPSNEVINSDKKKIISYATNLLSTDSIGSDNIRDSISLRNINTFLNLGLKNFEIELLEEIRRSLRIDFITYSPGFTHFVVSFSYKLDDFHSDSLYKYDGLIFIGEKSKTHIELFNYSETMYQYRFYKRKSVLYQTLSKYFSYLSRNLIDEQYKTHPHVLTREFWNCSFFFDSVKLSSGEKIARFKTNRQFVYQKPYIYVKKEYVKILN